MQLTEQDKRVMCHLQTEWEKRVLGYINAKDSPEKPYHYFVTSYLGFVTGDDLLEVLSRQKRADRTDSRAKGKECFVWRVPGPNEGTNYDIRNYEPQIEGAELLDVVTY
jgi:hypothetical protein